MTRAERDQNVAMAQAFQGVAAAFLELGFSADEVRMLASSGVNDAVSVRDGRQQARRNAAHRKATA